MAEQKFYGGSYGPFLYDDTDLIDDPDGDFAGIVQGGFVTSGDVRGADAYFDNLNVTGDIDVSGSVIAGTFKLDDLNDTHTLSIKWNEDDTADRSLDLYVGGADRTLYFADDGLRAFDGDGFKLWDDGGNLALHVADGGYLGLAGLWDNTSGQDVSTSSVSLVHTVDTAWDSVRMGVFKVFDFLRLPAGTYGVNYNTFQLHQYLSVATGVNVARASYLMQLYHLRNFDPTQPDDSGTFATMEGLRFSYGHFSSLTTADPQTTTVIGIGLNPYVQTGDVGTLHDIRIAAVSIAGGLSPVITTAHYPINQVQGDNITGSAAGISRNYFGARTGFKTTDPQGVVEIEDGGTTYGQLLKITQDNVDVKGIIIGNDTYSTTDANGLQLWVDNSGLGYINNVGGVLALNSVSGLAVTVPTLIMTNLTNGYVPYHVSDAVGLTDSPLLTNGTVFSMNGVLVAATDFYLYSSSLTNGHRILRASHSPVFTSTAALNQYTFHFSKFPLIATGQTITGVLAGVLASVLRNSVGASVDDSGTHAGNGLRGIYLQYGHSNLDSGEVPVTNSCQGIYLEPAARTGTIDTLYDIQIKTPLSGGTLSAHWSIYQEATNSLNYFNGRTGIKTSAPVGNLEIEDGATAEAILLKVTQDNADVIGIAVGNDTYSTTDANSITLKLDNAGIGLIGYPTTLRIGAATNYSSFEADGTLVFAGDATVWKDINLGAALIIAPSVGYPSIDELVDEVGADTGVETYSFGVGESVSGQFEIQHDYQEGGNITFHIHWEGIAAPGGGTDNVQWQLEYTITRDANTVNAITTIVAESAITAQYQQVRTNFAAITGSIGGIDGGNIKIGDQFCFVLSRIAASSDEYAGDALYVTAGLHYPIDTVGSRTIAAK